MKLSIETFNFLFKVLIRYQREVKKANLTNQSKRVILDSIEDAMKELETIGTY